MQGAKRSRPPPDVRKTPMAKSLSPESRLFGPRDDFDTNMDTMEVEEPRDMDGQLTPTKRQRTVEIEEVDDDVEMNISSEKYEVFEPSDFMKQAQPVPPSATPTSSSSAQSKNSGATPSSPSVFASSVKGMPFGKSSLPTQPSRLRASFTAEEDEPEEKNAPSRTTEAPKINGISRRSPKEMAMKMEVKALPTFAFQVTATIIDPKHSDASAAAKAKPISALPAFDLFKPVASTSTSPASSSSSGPSPPVIMTAAAAQKSTDAWECSLCMLKNPASVTDKCTVCEAPRPGVSSPAPAAASSANSGPTPLTTAAAALKSADTWTCSLCMLKNPASATDKCTVCEAPRSGQEAAASPKPSKTTTNTFGTSSSGSAATVFTTAAAAQKSQDSWTCSLCMLKNPASATDKCTVCENPRS